MDRLTPPADIAPDAFFTEWVPEAVAADAARREKLAGVAAAIVFRLADPEGGVVQTFSLRIEDGVVRGSIGAAENPDLCVDLDIATWRQLNAGEISAPQALLKRRVKLEGDFLLSLKLHLILG